MGTSRNKTKKNHLIGGSGGSCEIRTHGGLTSSPVFKTGALNRSAKLPVARILTLVAAWLCLAGTGKAFPIQYWEILHVAGF